jgi:transcriptional regulator with XRE-family HTH domain
VNSKKKAPLRRRRLGRRLRAMRVAAGYTLEEASKKLDKKRSSLHRIELGETRADVHLARSMMDLYDQFDEGLLDAVRAAFNPSWITKYGVQDLGYVDAETDASVVREFSGLNLPGLLQTEPYIQAVFENARRQRSLEHLRNQIKVRLIRKERLTSEDNPLELIAVIDEAALLRKVGAPEVMRAQLGHLIDMAELPAVTLHVLPLDGGIHSAMEGPFILLDFDPDEQPLLYHDYVTGALHVENSAEVDEARLVFDTLTGEALSPAESVALIERLL